MNNILKADHPKGLYLLFAVEMWERFSYYGMRALLVLYMVKFLMFDTQKAGQIYGTYTGLVYLTPLIGGYIADRYLGAKNSILIGGILIALGHFTLAFQAMPCFYSALAFLIIGNGFFKPNISTLAGSLYEKGDSRRDAGFTIFYMGINIGAFFSPLVCGTLGEKFGFHYGFAAAGVGMVLGLILYMWGKDKFLSANDIKEQKIQSQGVKNIKNEPLSKEEKQKIAVIFILMFFAIFFWTSFEQAGSSLTLFADRYTNRVLPFLNWEVPVSYFQSINPLLIMILAPLFSQLWIKLSLNQKEPSTPAKFAMGLGFVAFGFVLMIMASCLVGESSKVSALWLVSVYFFHTVGELCLSPVGISMVSKLAPVKFASMLMGIWFLSSFFANLSAGLFAGRYDLMDHRIFFLIPTLFAGISAIILVFLIKPIKRLMG